MLNSLAFADVWQVFVLLALEESVLQSIVVVGCVSQARTLAVRQVV